MIDLKPCPFCGSPAHIVWNARRKIYPPSKGIDAGECVGAVAYCENCGAQIFDPEEQVVEKLWNRRAAPKKKWESRAKRKCICGRKHLCYTGTIKAGRFLYGMECPNCGRRTGLYKTEIESIRAWNKMIDEETR